MIATGIPKVARMAMLGTRISAMYFNEAESRGMGYQTSQRFCGFIGTPALHENALANSGLSETGPFTRHCCGEWGSVAPRSRSLSGVTLVHQSCAKERKRS